MRVHRETIDVFPFHPIASRPLYLMHGREEIPESVVGRNFNS